MGLVMHIRLNLLASASVAALLHSPAAMAGNPSTALPAVSAPNGKVGAFAGSAAGESIVGVSTSWAAPLGGPWGAQFDGAFGSAGSAAFYGVGGHLFWRDPAKGLLGVTGSWVDWDKVTTFTLDRVGGENVESYRDLAGAAVGTFGVEAAAYAGRISLEGGVGYQFGTVSGARGRATIAYYLTDNFRIDFGLSTLVGRGSTFRAGTEWAPAGHKFSLFANASASPDASSVVGGLKVYFGGGQKSLIRRHREDDPENLLPDDLYTILGDKYCPADVTLLNGLCDSNN
jgi:hypothetical protein